MKGNKAMNVPRCEYPRPQFARPDWLCLNGEWQFEIDDGNTGLERGLRDRALSGTIVVPFCPESKLSGVEHVDFMDAVWYRREVEIPAAWAGRKVLLHFQAVDYDTTVWVNGQEVARHRGGFTPIACDLGGVVNPGETATIVVRAQDYHDVPLPRGKQSNRYGNYSCLYTRTTGIWQTVWLEPVPETYLRRPRVTPDLAHGAFRVEQPIGGRAAGHRVRVQLSDGKGMIATADAAADADFTPALELAIPAERRHLWRIEDPFLYDLQIELFDAAGQVTDRAASYAGLRSVTIDGYAVKINGQPVFQRLVLDQGHYRDGILTAPTDAALVEDIKLAQAAGFNGARLHQKVFEERFLYHADRLGYIVWGEFGDWGCSGFGPVEDHQKPGATYVAQWLEALERDYSHPSIVGWCGLNETWQVMSDKLTMLDDTTRAMYLAAKAMDMTRPVLDASGYSHRVADVDIYDSHDYEQDVTKFAARHGGTERYLNEHGQEHRTAISLPYRGQPYFVSEFGGTWWSPEAPAGQDSWGYGRRPEAIEEFYARFKGLVEVLLDNPSMFGYCYTQLTDVFQEQNGVFTFDRHPKFDLARLHVIQSRWAAIEK
jgi:beta-galactosidase/beta-glucuronidase